VISRLTIQYQPILFTLFGEEMKLQDAIAQLDSLDRDAHIFASPERPLHAGTTAVVGHFTEDDEPPEEAQGLREFLDVWHAKDMLDGKMRLLKIEEPISPERRMELFLSVVADDA
jgi:hypothetical protein